jgi:hypothetical protein
MTTDVSLTGAFVSTPPGTRFPRGILVNVSFTPKSPEFPTITATAKVVRSVQHVSGAGALPGIALEFGEFRTEGDIGTFTAFLRNTLGGTASQTSESHILRSPEGTLSFQAKSTPDTFSCITSASEVHRDRVKPERTLPEEAALHEERLRRQMGDIERRRGRRYALHVPVRFYLGDGIPHHGVVLSISQWGLFLQTDHTLPNVGTEIQVQFPLGETYQFANIRLQGMIRRHWSPGDENMPGFAIRYSRVDEQGKTGLFRMYLRRLENKGRPTKSRRGYHYSMVRRA